MPVKARDRLIGLIRAGLPSETTIGVALSGGGDSTALLHLALQAGFPVEAVTVDHRLRPESAEVGARVVECGRLQEALDDLYTARRADAAFAEYLRDPSSARSYLELRAELVAEGLLDDEAV